MNLKDLFPAGNPAACKVFQLCVLRDDLFLELQGTAEDRLPPLDRADRNCRMLYFFRRSILTLNEIASAINSPEYTRLTVDDADDSAALRELKTAARHARGELNKARDRLNFARNRAGGHVNFDRAAEVLRDYGHFRGPMDFGDRPGNTMYRVASHAMFLLMLDESRKASNDWEPMFEELVKGAWESTLSMIEAIDSVVSAYIRTQSR